MEQGFCSPDRATIDFDIVVSKGLVNSPERRPLVSSGLSTQHFSHPEP